MPDPQNFKNHTRFDPMFHFMILPALLINFIFACIVLVRGRAFGWHQHAWNVVMAVVLFMMAGLIRGYALKVQDRLIRTEERLRIAALVTPSELIELESLTVDQYVGLRFASNPELPDLARRAVREKLDRKQIKESIKIWRADNDRI